MALLYSKGKIIKEHMDDIIKSFTMTTGIHIAFYDHNLFIDTPNNYVNDLLDEVSKNFSISVLFDTCKNKPYASIHVDGDLYTIAIPLHNGHNNTGFFLLEPFTYKEENTELTKQNSGASLILDADRLFYLSSALKRFIRKPINDHKHSFDQDLQQLLGTVETAEICDHCLIDFDMIEKIIHNLIIHDIHTAIEIYELMMKQKQQTSKSDCLTRISRNQAIGLIVVLQYELTKQYEPLKVSFQSLSYQGMKHLTLLNDPISISEFAEQFINEYHNILKDYQHKELTPDVLVAIDFIHENYYKNIRLTDIASAVPMNPSYLSTKFKKQCHQSVVEYLNEYRIKQSIKLLKTSADNLTTIALKVGFESSNYFSTVFKKVIGVMPKEYLK